VGDVGCRSCSHYDNLRLAALVRMLQSSHQRSGNRMSIAARKMNSFRFEVRQ
jgi:hypothetical protein